MDLSRHQITIKPNSWIVYEGLDATGKTTQINKVISNLDAFEDRPMVTHQPSGNSPFTEMIYEVTEEVEIQDPLARQLLHLSCHAEQWRTELAPHFAEGGSVFMDRCWWSTIAYGFFGGGLGGRISYDLFEKIATLPEEGRHPDIVFLFTQPHKADRHNTEQVLSGYHFLAEKYSHITHLVSPGDETSQMREIFGILSDLNFIQPGG